MVPSTLEELKNKFQPLPPMTAVVLGSGLSLLADRLDVISQWAFSELPGLVASSVTGHRGQLLYGL
ncbi:MAG TPA: hypothetical protein PKD72_13120, partial [Gemmatales bacterium]|nr:hypothetical protein [Gemmatales bacterium]